MVIFVGSLVTFLFPKNNNNKIILIKELCPGL